MSLRAFWVLRVLVVLVLPQRPAVALAGLALGKPAAPDLQVPDSLSLSHFELPYYHSFVINCLSTLTQHYQYEPEYAHHPGGRAHGSKGGKRNQKHYHADYPHNAPGHPLHMITKYYL
jgi:hypothetical protein